jgi:hypothetical protein
MTVVATLKDGRIIAKASITPVTKNSAGLVYTSATLSELRMVEQVLGVNLSAVVQVTPQNPTVGSAFGAPANVVGLSVYVGASTGTPITGEVVALGF